MNRIFLICAKRCVCFGSLNEIACMLLIFERCALNKLFLLTSFVLDIEMNGSKRNNFYL